MGKITDGERDGDGRHEGFGKAWRKGTEREKKRRIPKPAKERRDRVSERNEGPTQTMRPANPRRIEADEIRTRHVHDDERRPIRHTVGAVTDKDWDDIVLKSSVPVLVDFWAPWCGPCRMIAPLIDEISAEYGEKIKCVKLNTDESPSVATEYGIRSIPTVMIFKDGQKLDTVIGAVPKSTLTGTIDKFLD